MKSTLRTWCFLLALLAPLAHAAEKWALVIGVDKCKALGELKVCTADARAVGGLLKQAGYNVSLLTDDGDDFANWPTIGNVERGVEGIVEVAENGDTILIFFSGHGVTQDGECYLVPVDGDDKKAVSLSWLKKKLAGSTAGQKVVILDACHAGAAKGVNGISLSHKARSNDLVMLLSCTEKQVSWPDEQRGHSVFTQHLLEGLRGGAAGADRRVTHEELFEYVRKRVRAWTFANRKPIQTPVMAASGTGETILASIPKGGFKTLSSPSSGVVTRPPAPITSVSLPAKLRSAFEIPTTSKDQHGNPVLKGVGEKTKLPKEIWYKQTGMEFVLIEPGTFQMGSNDGDDYEKPVHGVRITKPFYLGKYEVTQRQYENVVGENPSDSKGRTNPVDSVSWHNASKFCEAIGGHLPTEAQWEYACRAGSSGEYCFGNGRSELEDFAWYDRNSDAKSHPVGQKKPNGWGLYDMHGNVMEWCQDWYGNYHAKSPSEDPTGPWKGELRVLRGGCWRFSLSACRAADRQAIHAPFGGPSVGFRVLLRDF